MSAEAMIDEAIATPVLRDRMNFICDLLGSGQLDLGLFAAPYHDDQVAAIRAGRVPAAAL